MKKMAKRIVTLLLALLMVFGVLAGCTNGTTEPTDGENTGSEDPIKLWFAYNTERMMQDLEYEEEMEERDYTLRMYGIRDDVESAQLMITPSVNVVAYDFTVSDLTAESGAVISKDCIEIMAAKYVDVTNSYNMDSYYGYYPDALVPFENFKALHHNSITAGMNQSIWLNVNIPVDAAAGKYTGTGILDVDGKQYNVPIELTVFGATMPEQNHMMSSFDIWYHDIVEGEGVYSAELADEYFWFLVDKRVMPLWPEPSIKNNYTVYVDWLVEKMAENPDVASYGLPYRTGKVDPITGEDVERTQLDKSSVVELLTLMAKKNVELRKAGNETINLFEKAFYYLGSVCDEPTGAAFPTVRAADLAITQARREVADAYLKDYPDLYDSCMSVPHVVTTAYNTELLGSDTTGGVQAWCPQFQHWHTEKQREEYWERQNTPDREYGEDAWWYGCNNPEAPFPTYHLDDDLIVPRVISWMQFQYKVDGNLYWEVNNYTANMWNEAYDLGGAVDEGLLVYPGSRYGIDGPITTLRLESIREGCEDYECMWLMKSYIEQYNEEKGTDYDPYELMAPFFEDLYDGVVPVRDNCEVLLEQRLALLTALEALAADLETGMQALING